MEIIKMLTEKINPNTINIDTASSFELVTLINNEDKVVSAAVKKKLIPIAHAIDAIVPFLKVGGRLVYCGAGTSGRLGVLDASECPPTFGVNPDVITAIIAGGTDALYTAIEGVEDDEDLCIKELEKIHFSKHDVFVGIAASGTTPFVLAGLNYASNLGATTIGITCNSISRIANNSDISIALEVGPEVIAGSSRMKAATAQKMVLNMISTGVMVKLGKVYHNFMVDVVPTNAKLRKRAISIVIQSTGVTEEKAESVLAQCNYHPKTAIVMLLLNLDFESAKKRLFENDDNIRKTIRA